MNKVFLGDNLPLLQASDEKFDVIYIDPPYNVGDHFEYKNRWQSSQVFIEEFMRPRLVEAKRLLADDGVMFISICDEEYARLSILADEIFELKNRIGTIVWDKIASSPSKHLMTVHEYIIVLAKNKAACPPLVVEKRYARDAVNLASELKKKNVPYGMAQKTFKEWMNALPKKASVRSFNVLHPKTFRPFRSASLCGNFLSKPREDCEPVIHPFTKKHCVMPSRLWKHSKKGLRSVVDYNDVHRGDSFIVAGRMLFGKDEATVPRKIIYLDETLDKVISSVMQETTKGQSHLPDGVDFTTPKPVRLVARLVGSHPNKNAKVLDFFGGSGTTAHATHALNIRDGGNRSWVLMEMMELTLENVMLPRLRQFTTDFEVVR